MKNGSFLSLRSSSWGLSLGIHLVFVLAVFWVSRSRILELPLVSLDLAPIASSSASAPIDLDEWRTPLSKHKMVSLPKPKPTPNPQPASIASDGGPVRSIAQVTQLPHFKTMVKAVYPEDAKHAGIEGVVVLQVEIDASGTVMDAQVVQSLGYGCDESALAAVKQSVFTPAYADGKPVPVRIRIPYRFKIEG